MSHAFFKDTAPRAADGKYLTVTLGTEAYALSVLKVREIIRMTKITPVAQMPAYVRGVMNLRGKVIPVTDLRLKLGLVADVVERTCIVVVQVALPGKNEILMGLIVDTVEDVAAITGEQIEPAPHLGVGVAPEYLLGVAKLKGDVKILLDVDRVVAADTIETFARAS